MDVFTLNGVPLTTYVQRMPSMPLLVLTETGPPEECWTLPTDAEELVTRSEVIDEVWAALDKITLSKTARSAVEKILEALER